MFVAIVTVLLKKSNYVESHEFGTADMILQIILTLSIGFLCVMFVENIGRITGNRILIMCGNISYELYLAHVILLNWLKENPQLSVLFVYIGISALTCVLLVVIRKAVIEGALRYVEFNK